MQVFGVISQNLINAGWIKFILKVSAIQVW